MSVIPTLAHAVYQADGINPMIADARAAVLSALARQAPGTRIDADTASDRVVAETAIEALAALGVPCWLSLEERDSYGPPYALGAALWMIGKFDTMRSSK